MIAAIFALLPLIYAISIWGFSVLKAEFVLSHSLWFLLFSTAFLSGLYLVARKSKTPVLNWKLGIFLFGCAPVITPSLLQTDQLRYIWDGLHLSQGVNPYSFSPQSVIESMPHGVNIILESGAQIPIPWAKHINHPEFFTVYPPLAEILFAISTHLNPLFYSFGSNSGLTWLQKNLPDFVFWPWELGLRIMVGLALASSVFILRNFRWDLLLFHPLIFLTAVANIHVDALMLPLLALVFTPNQLTRLSPHGLLLSAAVLVRWLPGLFIPTAVIDILRREGARAAALMILTIASVCGILLYYFWLGSNGNMLSSPKAYAEHWYFFGFLHRFVMDLLIFLGTPGHPAQIAKALLAAPFVLSCAFVLWMQWKGRLSFQLASLLVLTFFFMVAPTLHPWYLISLLLVGFRFKNSFRYVWVWPLLAPLSYTYYFNMSDVPLVRIGVYLVISILLVLDGRLLLKRIRRLSIINAS